MEFEQYSTETRLNNLEELMTKGETEWEDLQKIYYHYIDIESDLYNAGHYLSEKLKKSPLSHIVHYRTKNPIHLMDKVVRKRAEKGIDINQDNYLQEITDLIGIRVIHLYKEDWLEIHKYISEVWTPYETPTAIIREGDKSDQYKEHGCEIKESEAGYRSVHYLLETKPFNQIFIAEVQVRTIFEEAWSEIDHDIRYPVHTDNALINAYLVNFNRIAGSADEMSSFLKDLRNHIDDVTETHKSELEKKNDEIYTLKKEVAKLSDSAEKNTISSILENMSGSLTEQLTEQTIKLSELEKKSWFRNPLENIDFSSGLIVPVGKENNSIVLEGPVTAEKIAKGYIPKITD